MRKKKASHFRIIGIKPCSAFENNETYYNLDRVLSIQKALAWQQQWSFFVNGICIDDSNQRIIMTKEAYDDFSIFDTIDLKITVSAIVGKNGSGKSSIVELFVRAINNLSAALLGEGFNFASAEHLHFIDGVYVDIMFQIDRNIQILKAHNRDIRIITYVPDGGKSYVRDSECEILSQIGVEKPELQLLKPNKRRRAYLRKLFYTMVCNYSLYGFNFRDFAIEATPSERLRKLKISVKDDVFSEESSWLKGIFHKNDGYQTPIVLHPMRYNGLLDIRKENNLAKERLLSLLFYKDEVGNYPMRIINGNLRISGIKVLPAANRKFARDNILDTLEINRTQNVYKNFDRIYQSIIDFWNDSYGIVNGIGVKYSQDAFDYIVYKTLKIILTYKKYNSIFRYLSTKSYQTDELKSKFQPLLDDHTHTTKKLRRTINYLIAPRFDPDDDSTEIEDFEIPGRQAGLAAASMSDPQYFLPPPIFNTDLLLHKQVDDPINAFIVEEDQQVHNAEVYGEAVVPFSGLSSGERQIAYTISNILYHMINVDSEWDDDYRNPEKQQIVRYQYMNIILDEVELYFHPEMQRCFLFHLIKSIQSVHFKHIKGLNILFATHSPFILSDIPSSNVLKLGSKPNEASELNTFGGNILQMLGSTFFMSSSIGESVRNEICSFVKFYNDFKGSLDKQEFVQLYKNALSKRFEYLVATIGDPFFKGTLSNMLNEIKQQLKQTQ